MTITLELSLELQARIEAIASRSSLSASEVIADALQNGRSLDWQEDYLDKVAAGVEAADSEQFASAEDVMRVVNKYRAT
jgi:predicted transcriptional regulator